jgi:hypothetical protein
MQRFLLAGLATLALAAFAAQGFADEQNKNEHEATPPTTRSLFHPRPAVHYVPSHPAHLAVPHSADRAPYYHPYNNPRANLHTAHYGHPNDVQGNAALRHEQALRNERLHAQQHASLHREELRQEQIRRENAGIEREHEREAARIRDERWRAEHPGAAGTSPVAAYAPGAAATSFNRYAPAAPANSPPPPAAAKGNQSSDTSADDSSSDDSNSADSDSSDSSDSDSASTPAQDPKAAAIGAILNLLTNQVTKQVQGQDTGH